MSDEPGPDGQQHCVLFREAVCWIAHRNFSGGAFGSLPISELPHDDQNYEYDMGVGHRSFAADLLLDRAVKERIRIYARHNMADDEECHDNPGQLTLLTVDFLRRAELAIECTAVRGFRLLSDEPAHNRYILFVRGQDGRGFGDLVVNHHDLTEEFWGDAAPAIAIRETTACPAIVPLRPDDVRITALADGSTAQGSISGCCCELAATLPRFLRFAVQMTRRLGVSVIAEQKKEITEAAIIEHWPEAQLGSASRSMVRYMATMLRPPEAQRGGAKRAHVA